MPKVTMYISSTMKNLEKFAKHFPLARVGEEIRSMVAKTFSTDTVCLDPCDVDFIPTLYPPGTLVASPIAIEIETIGFPDRKAMVTKEVMQDLKFQLFEVLVRYGENSPDIHLDDPLVWLKYQDPDGFHI